MVPTTTRLADRNKRGALSDKSESGCLTIVVTPAYFAQACSSHLVHAQPIGFLLFRGADFATTQLSKKGVYSTYVTDLIDKAG